MIARRGYSGLVLVDNTFHISSHDHETDQIKLSCRMVYADWLCVGWLCVDWLCVGWLYADW